MSMPTSVLNCRRLPLRAATFVSVAMATMLGVTLAHADDLPPPQLPPASARAPNGEYIAPMQQQTQQIYVPQSVALSGPRIIQDYEEGEAVPAGYHAETRVRRGLVIGGAVTFGALYMLSLYAGMLINDANDIGGKGRGDFLFVPVAGPFLQMLATDSSSGTVMLAIDGIGQAAGATMLIAGITSPKTVLVRNDLGSLTVTPMKLGQSGSGLGVVGTF